MSKPLIGGTGNDTITLGTAVINGSVDLGTGSDTLKLANFTNRVSVTNTETVLGGTGDDTVILTGSNASTVIGGGGMNFITGNAGADQFVLDQNSAGNISTILNFNTAKSDKIALDTSPSTRDLNAYDLGGAALVDGTNLKAVADAAARLGTTEVDRRQGRLRLPTGYRRAVLQRQRRLLLAAAPWSVSSTAAAASPGSIMRTASSRSSRVIK